MTLTRLAAIACAASLLASCASGGPRTGEVADADALERLYRARTDSALARFSPADVQFVTNMIAHHGQAIEMATLVPDRTANASLRTLAARIINAQNDEIALMERWLRDRGQAVPGPAAHDHAEHVDMPGMITPAELAELRAASGGAFDRLFLTSMIRHHRGALTMVEELLAAEAAVQEPATFKLASDIHVDQATEIARMEQMLATLGATLNGGGAG
jgi:uncharacterized protein (DUF305 family)